MSEEEVEELDYSVFIYPQDLDPAITERLKNALWTLSLDLFVYAPGENRTRSALEHAFEVLGDCSVMITVLNPKSAGSALVNQFVGYCKRDEIKIVGVSLDGARGMGLMSFAKTVSAQNDVDDIVSAALWGVIEAEELVSFRFHCQKCKEEDYTDLPNAGDLMKWQRDKTPIEVECGSCENMNRFHPGTLLPL